MKSVFEEAKSVIQNHKITILVLINTQTFQFTWLLCYLEVGCVLFMNIVAGVPHWCIRVLTYPHTLQHLYTSYICISLSPFWYLHFVASWSSTSHTLSCLSMYPLHHQLSLLRPMLVNMWMHGRRHSRNVILVTCHTVKLQWSHQSDRMISAADSSGKPLCAMGISGIGSLFHVPPWRLSDDQSVEPKYLLSLSSNHQKWSYRWYRSGQGFRILEL